LLPGKVSAKTSRHSTMSDRPSGSSSASAASRKTAIVIPGSRMAATSDVTDWGAL
jgi:hypothetical protein